MLQNELMPGELVKVASVSFVALFPLVNPLGSAPIFQALTRQYPHHVRRILARKVALYGFLLLVVSLVLGVKILAFLGISLPVVQVAGGLVVASTGWQLLGKSGQDAADEKEESLQAALTQAFYPLTLPLTVGPGSISVAIAISAHMKSGENIETLLATTAGMLVLCAMVWLVYDKADQLEQILGATGTEITIRLSAFALFALGLQIVWNGLTAALGRH
jgi:multiple antibiotic resistance protein